MNSAAIEPTLLGVSPGELLGDVYFRRDFVELHAAPDSVDVAEGPGFWHASAVRQIPNCGLEDLETPHGYGGPAFSEISAGKAGMASWRTRQEKAGRVAEFIRLHPFINPIPFRDQFDIIRFDRMKVAIDLRLPASERRRFYSKGTRHALKRAAENVTVRPLGPTDAGAFRFCYEAGLRRNSADSRYYFADTYFRDILEKPWCKAWVAEENGEPTSIACFLQGSHLAHYHLSGGTESARRNKANYLLLEQAFDYFQGQGCSWMHLGGGSSTDKDDSLLHFKTKFSPIRLPYYTCGMIFDPEAYRRLGGERGGRILDYRFKGSKEAVSENHGRLVLRPAMDSDFPEFFRLKCDVENNVWAGHDIPPDWGKLKPWFSQQLSDMSNRVIYLAEVGGQIVGYAYSDVLEDTVETSLGVDAVESGKGWGREILRQLCATLTQRWPERRIEAWIYPENTGSVLAHEAAGYHRAPERGTRTVPAPSAPCAGLRYCWVRQ